MIKKDLTLNREWEKLRDRLETMIGKKPNDLNGVLFLIGVQELGKGNQVFSKEEKQDLIHLGICKVLSLDGFYELEGQDEEGWPIWNLKKKIPHFSISEQEKLLKINSLNYFKEELGVI